VAHISVIIELNCCLLSIAVYSYDDIYYIWQLYPIPPSVNSIDACF